MPDQKGRFTPQERTFVTAYAATGDRGYSARAAGFSQPATAASKLLARPAVQAEIAAEHARLLSEGVPLATGRVLRILADDAVKPADHLKAAGMIFRLAGFDTDQLAQREPHEMTGEELARALATLEAVAAERAKLISPPAELDIFG